MNDTRQAIDINVREVSSSDIDFAWPIYRDFIQANIFSSGSENGISDEWNEAAERASFSGRWNKEDCYIIEVDGENAGWISVERREDALTVENIFLLDAWQNKGIATKIVSEMMPVWEKQKILLNIPVLKNATLSDEIEIALQSLGFKSRGEDTLTSTYGIDWR